MVHSDVNYIFGFGYINNPLSFLFKHTIIR
jgi:hypothetical protein